MPVITNGNFRVVMYFAISLYAHFIHLNKKIILIRFRLFKHYFLLIAVGQMSSSLFHLIAGVTRNMFIANVFSVFIMLMLVLLSGFIISSGKDAASNLTCSVHIFPHFHFLITFLSTSDNLNKFWMLGYWISPLMYAQNAISTTEFTANRWSKVLIQLANQKISDFLE